MPRDNHHQEFGFHFSYYSLYTPTVAFCLSPFFSSLKYILVSLYNKLFHLHTEETSLEVSYREITKKQQITRIFCGLIINLYQFGLAVPNYTVYRKFLENIFKDSKGNNPNFKQDTINLNRDNWGFSIRAVPIVFQWLLAFKGYIKVLETDLASPGLLAPASECPSAFLNSIDSWNKAQ